MMKYLTKEPLSRNARLQQAAKSGSKDYVRQGQEGPHVRVLQMTLNIIRTASYGYQSPVNKNKCVGPIWPYLSLNGKFDSHMKRTLERYQDWGNRFDRFMSMGMAKWDGPVGSPAYKKTYYQWRRRMIPDGIAGPVTLYNLNNQLDIIALWDEDNARERSR